MRRTKLYTLITLLKRTKEKLIMVDPLVTNREIAAVEVATEDQVRQYFNFY